MKNAFRLAICLALVLSAGGAFAQSLEAQTQETAAATASGAVAHVYVGSGNQILAFSAAANGKLTPVAGSPFHYSASVQAANGHYLFGAEPNSSIIDSFSTAANGALHKVASIDTERFNNYSWGCPLTGPGASVDQSGQNLYNAAIPNDGFCDSTFQSFKIDSDNGQLIYLGNTGGIFFGGSVLGLLGNNKFAYSTTCAYAFGSSGAPEITAFERLSNGQLENADAGVAVPAPPPDGMNAGYYCPITIVGDATNHAAMTLYAIDPNNGGYGPVVIATYTADAKGNLTTTSTYKNMATLPSNAGGNLLTMSPSGKILAASGTGVVLFHFNGGSPATKYTTLLAGNGIGQVVWDHSNHLYALGSDAKGAGRLWIYTVTPTSITEAPGSPYPISNGTGVVIQPLL